MQDTAEVYDIARRFLEPREILNDVKIPDVYQLLKKNIFLSKSDAQYRFLSSAFHSDLKQQPYIHKYPGEL